MCPPCRTNYGLWPTVAALQQVQHASMPIPDLIVKAAGADFPGLAANEYLCLGAAREAGIAVPRFDLSDDGQILVVDRFDIAEDGARIGFEDIAALMTLRVNDRLSTRKH